MQSRLERTTSPWQRPSHPSITVPGTASPRCSPGSGGTRRRGGAIQVGCSDPGRRQPRTGRDPVHRAEGGPDEQVHSIRRQPGSHRARALSTERPSRTIHPPGHPLPETAVVVHHGGAGTTFGALAHGVPHVIIPQGADDFDHAAIHTRAGTALTDLPDQLDPTTVADAVRRAVPWNRIIARRRHRESPLVIPECVVDDLSTSARRRSAERPNHSIRRPEIAREMTSCWISLVPSKIVWIFASRCQRSTGYSRV